MHQKKSLAVMTTAVLALAFCACAGKPAGNAPTDAVADPGVTDAPSADTGTAETETTAAPESDPASLNAIPDALMNTVLSGVNGADCGYAVRFEGEKVSLFLDPPGNVIDGYWALDNGTLHIYSDAAKTAEERAMQFDYNAEKNVLRLDGRVYMADTATDSLDAEAGRLFAAREAYEELRDTYWGGGDSAYALIFKLAEDGSCDMHYYDGSDGVIDEAKFFWAMGGDTIFFYNEDFAPVMHFNWQFDGNVFTLSDATTGNVVPCTALTEEQSSEVSRQLGVMAGAYESEGDGGVAIDYGNYQDFDVSVDP